MLYHIQRWQHGQPAGDYGTVEADSPREAIDSSIAGCEIQGFGVWQYAADADGAGSYSDPANEENFVEAVPQLELVAEHGDGDARVWLYRDAEGNVYVSNNAVTRERVTPDAYAGPGWDDLDVAEWLGKLESEFGSREAAELFARAALGAERVEAALAE